MNRTIRIVVVSDVSTGYGSRQILALLHSLVDYYQETEGIVIEPDQPEKIPVPSGHDKISIRRMLTAFHPYSIPGRIEYNLKAAQEVNKLHPDILVVCSEYTLPTLLRLAFKPKLTIYYALEFIQDPSVTELAQSIAHYLDFIIYPEENRARKDSQSCGFHKIPKVIIYNCADSLNSDEPPVSLQQRNGKILYSGTIEKERTFAKYFLRKEVQSLPVDLFGVISGEEKNEIKQQLSRLDSCVHYNGYISANELASLRRFYTFSIVMWNPSNENQLYAAPNKFFESIASGVPVIAAPHPQCKMLINRYKCGIIMENWSFAAFFSALQQAMIIYRTEKYEAMVTNCRKAFSQELNWDKQFEKVKPFLKEMA